MVKGSSRQAVIVRSPDPRLFEQAIFIVRQQAPGHCPSGQDVIREARRAAAGYLRNSSGGGRRLPAPVYAGLGAALSSAVWLLVLSL